MRPITKLWCAPLGKETASCATCLNPPFFLFFLTLAAYITELTDSKLLEMEQMRHLKGPRNIAKLNLGQFPVLVIILNSGYYF